MTGRRDCPILVVAETDARFRMLPMGCRWLWVALLRLAQANSVSVIRFGSRVPSFEQLAAMIATTQADLEAHLPALLEWGLLVREEDGALAAPFLRAAITRSEINRINGMKGGRPRKTPAPPQPAQREMLMPLPAPQVIVRAEDGVSPHVETEKPNLVSVSSSVSAAKLAIRESTSNSLAAVDRDEAKRVGRAAMSEAGLSFDGRHAGIVGKWLAEGATEDLILSTIRAKMDRGAKPSHLGYFGPAIREALASEVSLPASKVSQEGEAWRAEWSRDIGLWQSSGPWGQRGPMPRLEDYRPAHQADGSCMAIVG